MPNNITMTTTTILRPVKKTTPASRNSKIITKTRLTPGTKSTTIKAKATVLETTTMKKQIRAIPASKNTAMRVTEAAVRKCFPKYMFFKISQYS